ncbi:Sterol uptake control protein [Paramyrothecium foliicola]|nr:Sterol uptake control protein [Paramyrothecium foliicola]
MVTAKRGRSSGRRPHRKSRNGCMQCKQRHAKCDEFRPACVACTTAGRRCSFLDLVPLERPGLASGGRARSAPLSPQSAARTPVSTGSTCRGTTEPDGDSYRGTDSPPIAADGPSVSISAPPIFEMRHLILMHHFDTAVLGGLGVATGPDDLGPISMSRAIVESAEAVPYLLIEALALSAAHLSTSQTDPAKRQKHLQTAEVLQTQALSLFNQAQVQVTEDNCVPIFLFSSTLGMHALFNLTAAGPGNFIAKFIQYLQIHRGIRIALGDSWQTIRNSGVIPHLVALNSINLDQPKTSGPADETDILIGLLSESKSTLGEFIYRTYMSAAELLQQVFENYRNLPSHIRCSVIITWPLKVSSEYVDLVNQRQPIALLILTYWAVLLHHERKYWVFNNSGQLLVESVSEYVGPYWDKWLAAPRESVRSTLEYATGHN